MPAKKTAVKKTVAKKAAPKKEAVKKTIAKKQQVKKTVAKKAVPKKTEIKKPKAKKIPPKKVEVKKVEVKKTEVKKIPPKKEIVKKEPETSSLITQNAKLVKSSFFTDIEKEYGSKHKYASQSKQSEKPTASSRIKVSGTMEGKNLVEFLSQKLEQENRTYFEGCEGQICVKCNVNNVDQKFYVDKSLGYCVECAMLLNLGQSKEGVFSDAQMELMRRSMEKSMVGAKDIEDEDDIESAFGDMEELEEALLAVEEAEFNA